MVNARVYCSGACSEKSSSKAASSSSHSRVPRTSTPNGTTWQCVTSSTGSVWNVGWARSRSRGSGFLGVGRRIILASRKNEKVKVIHYPLMRYESRCHVERAGSECASLRKISLARTKECPSESTSPEATVDVYRALLPLVRGRAEGNV